MSLTSDDELLLHDLYLLLEEWRKLTVAEAAFINSDNWTGLEQLRAKKGHFQRQIVQTETQLFDGDTSSSEKKTTEKKRLRQVAEVLFRLEEKNCELIAKKMALVDSHLKRSDKTIRSLHHLQKAYGTNTRSFWQAYS